MSENCDTGCQDPKHMIECFICKAKYHFGIIHFCPTGFYSYPQPLTIKVINCPDCNSNNIGRDEDENYLCNDCGYHFDEDELLEPEDQNWSILGVEEEEDDIRKSKRKSIRNQGKYKGRGKEKRREP